jgi:uncharacterized protein (TIRG00374 family)
LRPIWRIVRPAFALLLTAYVLWHADPASVLDVAGRADVRWIGASVALVLIDRSLMAYRSVALLCTIAPAARPSLPALLRIFFVSSFAGSFLPASVGGDVVRAYSLARLQVPAAPAVASVLMDRLLGVVSIILVGAAGLAVARPGDIASTRAIAIALVLAASVSIAAGLVVFSEAAAGLAKTLALRLPFAPVRRIAGELTRATRAYGHHHGALSLVLAGSLLVQIIRILQAYSLGRALHIGAPLSTYFALIPLILLVMLLPVSINGIGPSQAAFVWFFGRAGVPGAEAFALSVLFVALGIVGNLPGGLLYAIGPPDARRR